ncbi:class I SAM-dependent methyltransferase [Flammeovirga sp. SubArs3]|uniref:class I SAM-dependent methyltransferase n=1 Tax=Flammeovirga sp. SubArs3 TaxID=2995316 RepID=UPI00248C3649|nr:class I SAM-dependent methyltransferase [Flammeovirga sp. SubArs3]
MNRKKFLASVGLIFTASQVYAEDLLNSVSYGISNFKHIYSNQRLKNDFSKFLKNVFHLYPEQKMHQLISNSTAKNASDKEIYNDAQTQLDVITPSLSIFNYKLPALLKQKDEMAKQTLTLLGEGTTYDGYLEIGSSGRYLDYLEEKVTIKGKRYYADGKEPGYAITEMIDRGQIFIGADYIPLADYNTEYAKVIPNESLDLVTVYIGFHHCPIDLRTQFISSIRDTLRDGGKLVLRDHDCDTTDQKAMVALAHDVFNMGTNESWDYNNKEVRNFYSLAFICDFIEEIGFHFDKRTLYQEGDPTKNALMLFTKI